MVDIKLRQWAEQALPTKSVESGWETLQIEFKKLIDLAKKSPDHEEIFDNLKGAVVEESIKRHTWEDKAMDMLRIIQLNTLEDRCVHDKGEWDQAVRFFEDSIKSKLQSTSETMSEMFGPGTYEKWFKWTSGTEDQSKRRHVKTELDKILNADTKHLPTLSYDEMTAVRKNVQRSNVEVDTDYIRETWYPVYRMHFLKRALSRAYDCRKGFYLYTQQQGNSNMDLVNCNDVVLFWRIQQVLKVTANALRQQVINREARRLDKEIKEVLDELSDDDDKKVQLLTGKRVLLAEELSKFYVISELFGCFLSILREYRFLASRIL